MTKGKTDLIKRSYYAGNLSLMFFHLGMALFAHADLLPPPNPFTLIEQIIVVTAILAALGAGVRLFRFRYNWLARWGYLWGIFTILLVFFGFVIEEVSVAPELRLTVACLLLAGLIVNVDMHLQWGSSKDPFAEKVIRLDDECN